VELSLLTRHPEREAGEREAKGEPEMRFGKTESLSEMYIERETQKGGK